MQRRLYAWFADVLDRVLAVLAPPRRLVPIRIATTRRRIKA